MRTEVFIAREKLSEEEKAAQKARQEQIRHLWQSAGIKDMAGVESLIQEMKKVLIEDMYQAESDMYFGYGKNDERPEESDNYRNGSYHKLVKTKDGKLELSVPWDRNGEFEPQVVKKHQMDITEIEDKIIGLYGCGMSTREISDNIKDIYGFEVSAETISNITNRILVDVKEWQSRALKSTYAVFFMDGMVFKVKKDGVIQKCTAYACIGVDFGGQKEGNFLRRRSPREDFRGIPTEKITGSSATLVRNSVKHVNYKDLKEVCADLKKIYRNR